MNDYIRDSIQRKFREAYSYVHPTSFSICRV